MTTQSVSSHTTAFSNVRFLFRRLCTALLAVGAMTPGAPVSAQLDPNSLLNLTLRTLHLSSGATTDATLTTRPAEPPEPGRVFTYAPLVLETDAINALLTAHALPASDRARLLRWERASIVAAMANRFLMGLKTLPSGDFANEWLTDTWGFLHLNCEIYTSIEYTRYLRSPTTYVPPAPLTAPSAAARPRGVSTYTFGPNETLATFGVGSLGQWLSYGTANRFNGFAAGTVSPEVRNNNRTASEAARRYQVLASMIYAGAAGTTQQAAPLGAGMTLADQGLFTRALLPFYLGRTATSSRQMDMLLAAALLHYPNADLTTALGKNLGGAFSAESYHFISQSVAYLNKYGARNPAAILAINPSVYAQELFGLTVKETNAEEDPGTAPAAIESDPNWQVAEVGGTAPWGYSFFRPMRTLQMLHHDGSQQSVRLLDGWFVIRDAEGHERMSLTVEYLDAGRVPATATRQGLSFFLTDASTNLASGVQAGSFVFRDWDGRGLIAKVGSGGQQADIAQSALPAGAVGQAYSQSFSITTPGPGTYSYAFVTLGAPLPVGLALSTAGVLSGTPRVAGTYEFEVHASNAPTYSHPVIKLFTLTITGAVAARPAGAVASYRFEDNVNDSTGTAHGAWLNGSPAYADGIVGRCAAFTGADGVQLPDNIFPTGDRSFETWFRTSQAGAVLGQFGPVGSTSYVPAVYVGQDGKLRVSFFYNGAATPFTSAGALNDGQWHHVAVTHSGTTQRVYLDGAQIGSYTFNSVSYAASYRYTLGFANAQGWPGWNGSALYMVGNIDEATIYNRALTAAEVAAIYAAGGNGINVLTLGNLPTTGLLGTIFNLKIAVTDGVASVASPSFAITGGRLPFGLALSGDGTVSGAAQSIGTFVFTVRATNSTAHSGERTYTIVIDGVSQPRPDSLVAWWRGENNPNSSPVNDKPLTGTFSYAAGLVGQSFNFNTGIPAGNPAVMQANLIPGDGSEFSFETWFRTTQSGILLHRTHVGDRSEPAIAVMPDGTLRARMLMGTIFDVPTSTGRTSVADGQWHHVAVTYQNGAERLYLDGALSGANGRRLPLPEASTPGYTVQYRLGAADQPALWDRFDGLTGYAPFVGQIDEPAVYNKALTSAEIVRIFSSGALGKPSIDIGPVSVVSGTVGKPYTQQLTPALSNPAWNITSGALPPGLFITSGGAIIGTPRTVGKWAFSVVLTNTTNGDTGARRYEIAIAGFPVALPAGATAWWRGEDNALDEIGTRHATMVNGTGFAGGMSGRAFLFDGRGSDGNGAFTRLPASAFPSPATNPTAPFTFEAWFQTLSPGVILGRQNSDPNTTPTAYVPAIYVGTDGYLYAEMFWNGSVSPLVSTSPVQDGQPHHVAVTWAGGVESFYLDGELMGVVTGFTQVHNSVFNDYRYQLGTGFTLGWLSGNGGWMPFSGIIDEPATYSRALSAAEVAAIYGAGGLGKTQVVTTLTLANGRVDGAYYASVFAAGTPTAVKITSGRVPPGLTLTAEGLLAGFPLTAGNFSFTTAMQTTGGAWQLITCNVRIDGTPAPRLGDANWYRGEGSAAGFVAGDSAAASVDQPYAAGLVGLAFSFDPATPRYLQVNNFTFPVPTGQWSFETWFRTTAGGLILEQQGASGGFVPMLYVDSGGFLRGEPYWRGSASTLVSTQRVDDGVFHHAALTYQNGVRKLYLDGQLAATATASGTIYSTGYSFLIGTGNLQGWPAIPASGYFTGLIDEPQFYTFALTATQVDTIYAAGDLGKSLLTLSDPLADTTAGAIGYAQTVTTTGASGPFTYRLARGRMPDGLSLNAAGQVTGSPTIPGTFDFALEATSGAGLRSVREYQILVNSNVRYRPAGIRAWWQATGGYGYEWTGAYPGTITGAGTAAGIAGEAFSFDGVAARIALPSGAFPTPATGSPFSFDAWFRADAPGAILGQSSTLNGSGIPNSGYVPMIYIGFDGLLYAQLVWGGAVDQIVSSRIVVDGTWHHVAATWDGQGNVNAYLDGEILGSRTGVAPASYAASYLYSLGRAYTGGAWAFGAAGWHYFDGDIDEISTWNRALTQAEIRRLVLCGTAGKATRHITPNGPLASGVRGRPYLQSLAVTGESAAVFTLRSGSLPPGLSLAGPTSVNPPVRGIFGTSSGAGTFDFIAGNLGTVVNGNLAAAEDVDEQFSLTINPLTNNAAYDLWAGAAGLTANAALPGSSPQFDVPNLLKYAFNLDPNAPDVRSLSGNAGLPIFELVDTPGGLVFRAEYVRRKNSGLTYTAELTDDLATNAFQPMGGTQQVTSLDADWERIIREVPATGDHQFGRVKVSQ